MCSAFHQIWCDGREGYVRGFLGAAGEAFLERRDGLEIRGGGIGRGTAPPHPFHGRGRHGGRHGHFQGAVSSTALDVGGLVRERARPLPQARLRGSQQLRASRDHPVGYKSRRRTTRHCHRHALSLSPTLQAPQPQQFNNNLHIDETPHNYALGDIASKEKLVTTPQPNTKPLHVERNSPQQLQRTWRKKSSEAGESVSSCEFELSRK
jgi:hypothetical protein